MTAPPPAASDHPVLAGAAARRRRTQGLSAAVMLGLFFLEGVVGAWVGSTALLAAAAFSLAQAASWIFAAAEGRLAGNERQILAGVVRVILAAVVLATLGELLRRLIHGGATDAPALARLGGLALVCHAVCASRLMRVEPGVLGLSGFWRLAKAGVIADGLMLAASGLALLGLSAWPDLIAGALILGLNHRLLWSGLMGSPRPMV